MTTTHPDEAALFGYVEGEPDRAGVAAHLRECPVCAARVAELRTAREALRSSLLGDLPRRRSRNLLDELDRLSESRRERVRRLRDGGSFPFSSAKRALAIATPIAAVLVVLLVLASTSGTGDEQGVQTTGSPGPAATAPLRSVEGKPGQVARYLDQLGLDAQAVDRRVEVRGATAAGVREALRGIGDGPVAIVLVPAAG